MITPKRTAEPAAMNLDLLRILGFGFVLLMYLGVGRNRYWVHSIIRVLNAKGLKIYVKGAMH